jgi:hypothetical protein
LEETALTADTRLPTRRATLILAASAIASVATGAPAAPKPAIKVSKDPNCGCCTGWVEHLRNNGFTVTVVNAADLQAVKQRLGVPAELASCHTAEIAGYVIEGHVPAYAIHRLLAEKPAARGLAVPGMPIGSPGMDGGRPEVYEVLLFSDSAPVGFGRYLGDKPV